jgi:hypothetical protein
MTMNNHQFIKTVLGSDKKLHTEPDGYIRHRVQINSDSNGCRGLFSSG